MLLGVPVANAVRVAVPLFEAVCDAVWVVLGLNDGVCVLLAV